MRMVLIGEVTGVARTNTVLDEKTLAAEDARHVGRAVPNADMRKLALEPLAADVPARGAAEIAQRSETKIV